MMAGSKEGGVPLPELRQADVELAQPKAHVGLEPTGDDPKTAQELETVLDVPVRVSAILGRTRVEVGQLMQMRPGLVLELDRKVGEAIDIYVNDRLVARGEVVLVEDKLGVTMTEIIKSAR
jgi:flagellar motor switch protein FliN/FliY